MPEKVKRESARERRRRQIGEFHDALAGARTMADACEIAGISARTGARWIHTNDFADIYSERHRATIEAASGLLRAGGNPDKSEGQIPDRPPFRCPRCGVPIYSRIRKSPDLSHIGRS